MCKHGASAVNTKRFCRTLITKGNLGLEGLYEYPNQSERQN